MSVPERAPDPLPEEPGERRQRNGHAGMRRAGPFMVVLFLLIPPVLGSGLAAGILTEPSRVPWVLTGGFLAAVLFFLLATPLARRSDEFRVAGYRRAAEAAVLAGLTAGATVAYTLLVYLLVGYRTPWAARLLEAILGG